MPVNFDPPECVVITDRSPVAAGGIANVSRIFRAEFRLAADDRLCGSLILSFQDSFPIPFGIETPDLTTLRLHGVPSHSAVWTFLPKNFAKAKPFEILRFQRNFQGENPGSQSASYSIHVFPDFATFWRVKSASKKIPHHGVVRDMLIKRLTKKVS